MADTYTGTWVKCPCCGGSGYHGTKPCSCVGGRIWVDTGTEEQQKKQAENMRCANRGDD